MVTCRILSAINSHSDSAFSGIWFTFFKAAAFIAYSKFGNCKRYTTQLYLADHLSVTNFPSKSFSIKNLPLQKNLWAVFGTGNAPSA